MKHASYLLAYELIWRDQILVKMEILMETKLESLYTMAIKKKLQTLVVDLIGKAKKLLKRA